MLFPLMLCLLIQQMLPAAGMPQDDLSSQRRLNEAQLTPIAEIVEEAICNGKIPGAVVLVGNRGEVVYRRAFGYRAIEPVKLPMTEDTIFDLGSLTKVVATATALMQLAEKGKLRIEDPVIKYWPEFKKKGKGKITIRQLLTHYSGLRDSLDSKPMWSGYQTALRKILAEKPLCPPETRFIYSDINFIVLGELVSRISGKPLDIYCAEHIFKPLGMKDTGFNPSRALLDRIAPTQYQYGTSGRMLWGEVHDPISNQMGGVAGHAGLFSTAEDLSLFAQMLLNGGNMGGVSILSSLTVERMTVPQTPPDRTALRGLGWDIDSPFTSNRGEIFPVGSYGHTGFTGTSIWIDPFSRTYVIILTNRVHPKGGNGNTGSLYSKIATTVASSLEPASMEQVRSNRQSLTSQNEPTKEDLFYRSFFNGRVQTGIDVLVSEKFASLAGLRVGLITNHSGLDSAGRRTIDLLHKAPRVKLVCVFVPEHGLFGDKDSKIASMKEPKTGLPVYSLYGDMKYPTEKMLRGLDAMVFDVQDVGVRFYTYITTMGYAMEAAAKKGMAFYVLDRPIPINGSLVQGPVMDPDLKSFVGYFPMPVRHGMTVGELAGMFNAENRIGVKLHVIRMRGYQRTDWYDETGLQWVNPSPNLRTLTEAILYPGVAMVEGANVSVGRGTGSPFELLGAPWMNEEELASYLNERGIQGVRFIPVHFMPVNNPYGKKLCHGVRIVLVDRKILDSAALGVEIACALYKLYPNQFLLEKILPLVGSHEVIQAVKKGQDPNLIVQSWREPLEQFLRMRSKYLLY
jgi:uncharacterized protein YbbC (DUF1343 family)/CubicO group peptidase (beta-lactamase class C family)